VPERRPRGCEGLAVAGQFTLSVGLSLAVRRTYNVRALQIWWKVKQQGFIGFDANPLGLVSSVVNPSAPRCGDIFGRADPGGLRSSSSPRSWP